MKTPPPRAVEYRWFAPITTRWSDNDIYGHVNNVTFYSYFDSAANLFLIREGGLEPERSPQIALVVSSSCAYHRPVAYPAALRAGVRVDRLGERSVTWGLALFEVVSGTAADLGDAAAHGQVVHVFVDRATRKPAAIPARMRAALQRLVVPASGLP